MTDHRPSQCRFRLRDEGKAYPRSSCDACGKTVFIGLGTYCTAVRIVDHEARADALARENERLREALASIKSLLSYASQDSVSAAQGQANKNLAWHIASTALEPTKADGAT